MRQQPLQQQPLRQQPESQQPESQQPPQPQQQPRFRLPVRSVVLLALAASMVVVASLVVTRGQDGEQPPAPAGDDAASAQPQAQPPQQGQQGQPPAAPEQEGQQATTGSFGTQLQSDRLTIELVVVPARAGGPNQLHLTGLVPDGNLADIQDLSISLFPPDGGSSITAPLRRLAANHLLATGVLLDEPGDWRVELQMRVRETDIDQTYTIDPFRPVSLSTTVPVA